MLPKRPPDPQKPPKGESFDSLPLWTSPLNDQGRGPAGPLSLDPSQGFSNNKKPTPAAYFVTPPGFGWVVFYCSVSHPAGGCGQPPLQGQDHSTRRDGFNGGPAKAVLSLCGERRSKGADGVFAAGGNGRSGLCDDAVGDGSMIYESPGRTTFQPVIARTQRARGNPYSLYARKNEPQQYSAGPSVFFPTPP